MFIVKIGVEFMKKKYLITFILFMFIFTIKVSATSSISCKPLNVNVGDQITCSVKTDEPVEISSKLSIVAGDTTMEKDGNIVYKASSKGTYDVMIKTINPGFSDKTIITVSEKTTTTTTKTTTTTTKAKSDNNYLASIIVDGVPLKDFSKSKTKYFIELDNDVVNANIKAEAEDENAKVEIDGPKSLNVGDNEYTISVTSENNTTKFYKVIVTRKDEEESSNTDIKSIKIKGYHLNFDKNSKTFHLNINKEDTELDITVNTKDKNASYEIEGNESLKDGSVIKIIVTAEDGSSDTYRIIIEKKSSNVMSFVMAGIILIIIIGLVIFFIIKKNKNKAKKIKTDEPVATKEQKKESYTEEKTIEMPVINKDNNTSENENVEDDDIPLIDNDEEEETRILSYAEREELERNKLLDSDIANTIDEELDKTLLFDYNKTDNDDDEY